MLEKIDKYKALLDEKDRLKDATTENNKAVEQCRDELAQLMIDAECQKISRSGFTYFLQAKTKYSKASGKDDELFEVLREAGLGDLIKETVNAQTLQGAMTNLVEENGGDLPAEFVELITTYEYTDVAKRRETSKG
jgi:Fe-S oxidoreductase